MSETITTHPDILTVLTNMKAENFRVTDVRDLLMAIPGKYKNRDSVRVLVRRNLCALESKGLLESSGVGVNKIFTRTSLFYTSKLIGRATGKRALENIITIHPDREGTTGLNQLAEQQTELEAELSIALAETEEYQSMMKRYPALGEISEKLHTDSKRRSATLLGRFNAVSNVINLFQSKENSC